MGFLGEWADLERVFAGGGGDTLDRAGDWLCSASRRWSLIARPLNAMMHDYLSLRLDCGTGCRVWP